MVSDKDNDYAMTIENAYETNENAYETSLDMVRYDQQQLITLPYSCHCD